MSHWYSTVVPPAANVVFFVPLSTCGLGSQIPSAVKIQMQVKRKKQFVVTHIEHTNR